LHSPNVGKMFDYFTDTLGFSPEFRVRGPDGRVMFGGAWWGPVGTGTRVVLGDIEEALHGHYDHGAFGRQMKEHPLGTGVVVYFYTRDVDALYARITKRGAVIDEPPTDQFWGERTISVVTRRILPDVRSAYQGLSLPTRVRGTHGILLQTRPASAARGIEATATRSDPVEIARMPRANTRSPGPRARHGRCIRSDCFQSRRSPRSPLTPAPLRAGTSFFLSPLQNSFPWS